MTTGKPMPACTCSASSIECASDERAEPRPIRVIASLNFSRSSALSIASREAPIISTPYFSSTPSRAQVERAVERGLPAHRRQQRVGPLLLDDARSTICQVIGSM